MHEMAEMVDSWMKSQKEFLNSLVKAQEDGVDRWLEATVKMQDSLQGFGGPQEGPSKELRGLYGSLMATMMSSAKAVAADSVKVREAWKNAVERQLDFAGDLMKQCAGQFPPAVAQK